MQRNKIEMKLDKEITQSRYKSTELYTTPLHVEKEHGVLF